MDGAGPVRLDVRWIALSFTCSAGLARGDVVPGSGHAVSIRPAPLPDHREPGKAMLLADLQRRILLASWARLRAMYEVGSISRTGPQL